MGQEQVYDTVIIGAGPAGVTASIYAARKKMSLVVIADEIGGQVAKSWEIENYTGYQYISGSDLTDKFQEHMEKFGFDYKQERVKDVNRTNGEFKVTTDEGKNYTGKTLIYATGARAREMGVPGEEQFKNRGVTYCATCDGPLFQGYDVAIVGGGNSGLEAVIQMSKIAKKVYLIEIMPQLKGDEILVEKVKKLENVEIMTNAKIVEVRGEMTVNEIDVEHEGQKKKISLQAIIVEIGYIPNSELVDFVEKNRWNEIKIDESCKTNVPGFFAAGDVSSVPVKQIVVAAAEGCKAALTAFDYLNKM